MFLRIMMNVRYQVCKIYFCIDVQIQKIPIVSVLKENVLGLDHRFGHLSALQGGLACRPGIYSRPAPPGNESPGYKPNPAEAGCSRFGLHIGRNDDQGPTANMDHLEECLFLNMYAKCLFA